MGQKVKGRHNFQMNPVSHPETKWWLPAPPAAAWKLRGLSAARWLVTWALLKHWAYVGLAAVWWSRGLCSESKNTMRANAFDR